MFVTMQHWGKQLQLHHETVRIDGQCLWDHAVQFARWQHPAVGECCCVLHRMFSVCYDGLSL